MKKYCWITGVLIVFLTVLCVVLWQQKGAEHTKMENLCQSSAAMALENFINYKTSDNESDYVSGVAEFRSFMTAYLFLSDNNANAEYIWCNIVYGEMTLHPEKVQNNIQRLIDALKYLSKDYDNPNGFNLISVYSNELTHGND